MAAVADENGLTSLIVVAADSGPLLSACVDAALASDARVEVIVVDNASTDAEPERIAALHAHDARFQLFRNERNIGFGPACNRGAAVARGHALVFLNPDCMIEPQTISALRAIAAHDRTLGLLGIEIMSPDGTPARGNRRRDPTLRRALMSMSGLSRFASRWPALQGVEMVQRSGVERAAVEVVDAVSGACMFVPRRVFEAVGRFDEGYFLHVEDIDLCRRVRAAGYAVAIAGSLRAVHAQGSSSRRRPLFVDWHKHRGMWRYFTRFDPAARSVVVRALVWIGLWTHFALTAPLRLVRSSSADAPRSDGGATRTRVASAKSGIDQKPR